MRRLVIFIFILFLAFPETGAQWYKTACGAGSLEDLNQQQFDCLWKKSQKLIRFGRTTTMVGSSAILAGGITMLAVDPCCSSGLMLGGYFILLTGFAIDAVGVPAWIMGSHRKSRLRSYNPSMNHSYIHWQLSPTITTLQVNNQVIPCVLLRAEFPVH